MPKTFGGASDHHITLTLCSSTRCSCSVPDPVCSTMLLLSGTLRQPSATVINVNTRAKATEKEEKLDLGLCFQSVLTWPCYSGPVVGWYIMTENRGSF